MKLSDKFKHGGNIHEILRQQPAAAKLLDFSANINPLGLPQSVREAVRQNIEQIIHYPDPQAVELKQAIAEFYNIDTKNLVLGNGAVELLYVLFHALQPPKVLIPIPSFSEYERAARACQAEIIYHKLLPENNFCIDWSSLLPQLKLADCLVLGNPNNPTGNLILAGALKQCLDEAKRMDCFVVLDESFLDFLPDSEKYTCRKLVNHYDNLLILQSLTKFYAIPGLRLGFALTNPILAKVLECSKDPWNVNLLAQKAGIAALSAAKYQQESRRYIEQEKLYLGQQLKKIPGLKVYKPTVNFILMDLTATVFSAECFRQAMLQENILIRDCSNYPGLNDSYIRIAVKKREENDRLLQAMHKIFRGATL